MLSINQIFHKLYQEKKLAHFYVLRSQRKDGLDHFLSQFSLENTLKLNPSGKNYRVEDLEEFWKFLTYRPIGQDRKVALFSQAEKLDKTLSNKLLKVLEEPPSFATLIFMTASDQALMETIESRALTLYDQEGEKTPPYELTAEEIEELKKDCADYAPGRYSHKKHIDDSVLLLMDRALEKASRPNESYSSKQEVLELVREVAEDREFRQTHRSMMMKLFTVLESQDL